MTVPERPAGQCEICDGTGNLVHPDPSRGMTVRVCGNCGGSGVLPERPAVADERCECTALLFEQCPHCERQIHAVSLDCDNQHHPFARPAVEEGPRRYEARPMKGIEHAGANLKHWQVVELDERFGFDRIVTWTYQGSAADNEANARLVADALNHAAARPLDQEDDPGSLSVPLETAGAVDAVLPDAAAARSAVVEPSHDVPPSLDRRREVAALPADDPRDEDDDVEAARLRVLRWSAYGSPAGSTRQQALADFEAKVRESERRRGVAVPQAGGEAAIESEYEGRIAAANDFLAAERRKFQHETLVTSALFQMVYEAAELMRHVHPEREAHLRDVCATCAFTDKADRLKTDVTANVLGLEPAP